ncbi:predicted protein [Lichtheimia corymbifera JMRC:FSU:9682]|uniref:Uncharacterized protein n=1 Tax=Lichtheimia corymbifera JMRC:FSU:9682 TaxID=1263082 RepID=A0A068SI14_9FUNG|nr:predicted protein [Lichtheimia corymbifera JMRC:FSU:9682]
MNTWLTFVTDQLDQKYIRTSNTKQMQLQAIIAHVPAIYDHEQGRGTACTPPLSAWDHDSPETLSPIMDNR